jgi:hypothetical protein
MVPTSIDAIHRRDTKPMSDVEKDAELPAEARLEALLHDLDELSVYLAERGRHTYELAQRFMEHARQDHDASSRAYDERQATMLGYQRHVWVEIAGLVNKLIVTYGGAAEPSAEVQSSEADQLPEEKS